MRRRGKPPSGHRLPPGNGSSAAASASSEDEKLYYTCLVGAHGKKKRTIGGPRASYYGKERAHAVRDANTRLNFDHPSDFRLYYHVHIV